MGTSKIVAIIAGGLVLCAAAVSSAGILNGNPLAYNDGNGPAAGAWTGTLPFDNGNGLEGNLDFAVFTEAVFNANFSGLGYVPSSSPTGGLVYTYQLSNTTDPTGDSISAEIVGVVNPANTIGSFNVGDVVPSLATFSGGNAVWQYNPSITAGQTSWGMAFSSPNAPMSGVALTVDGGGTAQTVGVPTPSAIRIPEPGSVVLWALLSVVMLMCRRSR